MTMTETETTTAPVLTARACFAKALEVVVKAETRSASGDPGLMLMVAAEWRHLAESLARNPVAPRVDPWAPLAAALGASFPVGTIFTSASVEAPVLLVAWAMSHPGTEVLFGAADQDQVEAMSVPIEAALREADVLVKRSGLTHTPFSAKLTNGTRIIGLIPPPDGAGMKGLLVHFAWWHGDVPLELVSQMRPA